MGLRKEGWVILNYYVVQGMYPKQLFGLHLPLQVEESESVTEDCRFLIQERTKDKITGVVNIGNGQLKRIVLTVINNDEMGFDRMLTYKLQSLPDKVLAGDERLLGKDW